jgi:hypothetical protein
LELDSIFGFLKFILGVIIKIKVGCKILPDSAAGKNENQINNRKVFFKRGTNF